MQESRPGGFLLSDMGFKKQQLTAVAGQPCTNWVVTSSSPEVNGTVACITDDGVLLRLSSQDPKDPPQLLAQSLTYTAAPGQFFTPPAGFMRFKPPCSATRRMAGQRQPDGRSLRAIRMV